MAESVKADDVFPLVAGLNARERVRLLRLITRQQDADDAAVYRALPPGRDEFGSDEEPLAWEADGWDEFD